MALPYGSLYGNFTSYQNCNAKHTRPLCYAPGGGCVRLGINKVVMVLNMYVYWYISITPWKSVWVMRLYRLLATKSLCMYTCIAYYANLDSIFGCAYSRGIARIIWKGVLNSADPCSPYVDTNSLNGKIGYYR